MGKPIRQADRPLGPLEWGAFLTAPNPDERRGQHGRLAADVTM